MSLANCCRCRLCALAALTQWHSSLNSKSSKHLLRMTLFREISFGSVTFGNRTSMYAQHVQANCGSSQFSNWKTEIFRGEAGTKQLKCIIIEMLLFGHTFCCLNLLLGFLLFSTLIGPSRRPSVIGPFTGQSIMSDEKFRLTPDRLMTLISGFNFRNGSRLKRS